MLQILENLSLKLVPEINCCPDQVVHFFFRTVCAEIKIKFLKKCLEIAEELKEF